MHGQAPEFKLPPGAAAPACADVSLSVAEHVESRLCKNRLERLRTMLPRYSHRTSTVPCSGKPTRRKSCTFPRLAGPQAASEVCTQPAMPNESPLTVYCCPGGVSGGWFTSPEDPGSTSVST